jgi:hypothetical protein
MSLAIVSGEIMAVVVSIAYAYACCGAFTRCLFCFQVEI